jgi:hypothetical protein
VDGVSDADAVDEGVSVVLRATVGVADSFGGVAEEGDDDACGAGEGDGVSIEAGVGVEAATIGRGARSFRADDLRGGAESGAAAVGGIDDSVIGGPGTPFGSGVAALDSSAGSGTGCISVSPDGCSAEPSLDEDSLPDSVGRLTAAGV